MRCEKRGLQRKRKRSTEESEASWLHAHLIVGGHRHQSPSWRRFLLPALKPSTIPAISNCRLCHCCRRRTSGYGYIHSAAVRCNNRHHSPPGRYTLVFGLFADNSDKSVSLRHSRQMLCCSAVPKRAINSDWWCPTHDCIVLFTAAQPLAARMTKTAKVIAAKCMHKCRLLVATCLPFSADTA